MMPDPHPVARTWRDIRELLDATELELEPLVRRSAQVVFETLARAEARVHGIEIDEVHFHEIGALDSIADVAGSCAAVYDLGVDLMTASPLALGSGTISTDHGMLAVPNPTVLELAAARTVAAAGADELARVLGLRRLTVQDGFSELNGQTARDVPQECAAAPARLT
jgi:uncharacterized protein (DUF111 family)